MQVSGTYIEFPQKFKKKTSKHRHLLAKKRKILPSVDRLRFSGRRSWMEQ